MVATSETASTLANKAHKGPYKKWHLIDNFTTIKVTSSCNLLVRFMVTFVVEIVHQTSKRHSMDDGQKVINRLPKDFPYETTL